MADYSKHASEIGNATVKRFKNTSFTTGEINIML